MKDILNRIENKMAEILDANGISKNILLNGGQVHYCNGNDGTEFDWVCNERLCEFETFYDDEDQYGAAKILVQKDGGIYCVAWGDHGHGEAVTMKESNFVTEEEAFNLAAFMYAIADNENKYDLPLSLLDTNIKLTSDMVTDFEICTADEDEEDEEL